MRDRARGLRRREGRRHDRGVPHPRGREEPRVAGFVGTVELELLLAAAASLKDKRRVLKGFRDSAQRQLGAAVAEVGHHEQRQRATLLCAIVSRSPGDPRVERLRRLAEARGADVVSMEVAWRSAAELMD